MHANNLSECEIETTKISSIELFCMDIDFLISFGKRYSNS